MATSKRRSRRESIFSDSGELNLTPLLDVIFNLIFFFILATNIRQKEAFFDFVLPESAQAPEVRAPEEIPELTVSRDGELALNGEIMPIEQIRMMLADIAERSPSKRAILSPDGEATMNQVTIAADLLQETGFRQVMQRVRRRD